MTVNDQSPADAASLITLSGVPASPYTRKMLALLRYRRLPYRLVLASHEGSGLPRPKVSLLPTFYFAGPDGSPEAVTDSTPVLRRLDAAYPARRARPDNPALALLDSVLEDYGDEWLTKAMFHYRWMYDADIRKAASILPAFRLGRTSDQALAEAGDDIAQRQIGRLRYVGSNETTGPVIEAGYRRFLDAMEAHLRKHSFLLGARPGAGDFGVFGQLTQLTAFDPTPMAVAVERAPRVVAWVGAVEDLSGLEPAADDWFDPAALPETVRGLLVEVGRVYAPLLLANARALSCGEDRFEAEVDGRAWVQQTFPYQAKCLGWLRAEHDALDASHRSVVDAALQGTGCDRLFAAA